MIATCAIIVNSKNELLLIQRSREPFDGYWALVSGTGATEGGMEPQEAVIGEVMTDLQTTFIGKEIFRMPVVNDHKVSEIIVFKGSVDESKIEVNLPFSRAYQWVSFDAVDKLGPIAFEHNQIINRYLNNG